MDFSIKTSIGIGSFVLMACCFAKASDVVYAPAFCDPAGLTVTVTNTTSEAQRVWTQVRFDDELREDFHDVAPKAQIHIPGSTFLSDTSGFSMKSWEKKSLQFSASCDDGPHISLENLTSPEVTHWLPSAIKTVKIHLLNLFLKSNAVTVKAFSRSGSLLGEKQVVISKYYDTESFKWTLPEAISRVEIVGQERLHSWLLYEAQGVEKPAPALAVKPVSLKIDTNKTYFLISTKEARPEESFVIALDDPQKIATAREQIKNKSLEKIVVAGIELGHGGFNRAFSSRDKSPYSWSVNRVDAFADFAHISCDGSPDLTEERLMQNLNEGGRICFWRYRVVRELTAQEVRSGKLNP